MITYNDIYEASRKERYNEQLQPLAKNFIEEVSAYFKEKKEATANEDDVFSDSVVKTKKQLENAITLFRELMLRRRKKILGLVLIASETGISKQDFEHMLTVEKQLFEDLMQCVDTADKRMTELLSGQKEVRAKHQLLLFTDDVESFVGLSGETIGPFEKGQIANLPVQIAQILISDHKAQTMEEK